MGAASLDRRHVESGALNYCSSLSRRCCFSSPVLGGIRQFLRAPADLYAAAVFSAVIGLPVYQHSARSLLGAKRNSDVHKASSVADRASAHSRAVAFQGPSGVPPLTTPQQNQRSVRGRWLTCLAHSFLLRAILMSMPSIHFRQTEHGIRP